MSQKPIIMSIESITAIRRGGKTQTRRPIKPQPTYPIFEGQRNGKWVWSQAGDALEMRFVETRKPRYQVGDVLWVKERWRLRNWWNDLDNVLIGYADGTEAWYEPPETLNDYWADWLSSRITRLMERNGEREEPESEFGKVVNVLDSDPFGSPIYMPKWVSRCWLEVIDVRAERIKDIMGSGDVEQEGYKFLNTDEGFVAAWEKLNAKRGFSFFDNPWVWVYEFKRRG